MVVSSLRAVFATAMVLGTSAALDYPLILTDDFHVGHTHETNKSLVHISLRYTPFKNAEKYEICRNCDIDDNTGVRTGESGTVNQIPKDEIFCERGIACVMESYYPVGTSKFNIRAATEAGWTRWSSHRMFKIDSDEPFQEPTWDVKMANEQYPGLGPHLHIGDFYPSDRNFVHVSLRHTFFAGSKEYQVCANCIIEDGSRKSQSEGTTHEYLSAGYCTKGPICVCEFYQKLGVSQTFHIRALTKHGWTPWSNRRVFDVVSKSAHTEL